MVVRMKRAFYERHGKFGTRLYNTWGKMKSRCNNPNDKDFARYGGRGIKVCEDWIRFSRFEQWALHNGYSDNLTIDRIDNDGDYEPSNCKWSTMAEQNNNRSLTRDWHGRYARKVA